VKKHECHRAEIKYQLVMHTNMAQGVF